MAHFAQLNENNEVIYITMIDNSDMLNAQNVQSESVGINYCKSLFGEDTKWVQTSYNGTFRKNYASIGGTYNPLRDAFISTKPFNSWVLEEESCQWFPPTPDPSNENEQYTWNEETKSWVLYLQG